MQKKIIVNFSKTRVEDGVALVHQVIGDNELMARMSDFGCDRNWCRLGLVHYKKVNKLIKERDKKDKQRVELTKTSADTFKKARAVYADHRAIGRVLFKDGRYALYQKNLSLDVPLAIRVSRILEQARNFYTTAFNNQNILDRFMIVRLSKEKLGVGFDLIKAALAAEEEKVKAKEAVEKIARARNLSYNEFMEWISLFRLVYKLALKGAAN